MYYRLLSCFLLTLTATVHATDAEQQVLSQVCAKKGQLSEFTITVGKPAGIVQHYQDKPLHSQLLTEYDEKLVLKRLNTSFDPLDDCYENLVNNKQTASSKARVYFEFDKSNLTPASIEILKRAAPALNNSKKSVVVTGHTDSVGSEQYNQKLALKRAQSVEKKMLDNGLQNKAKVKSAGESQPIADNKAKLGRAKNRRVEIDYSS